MLLTISTTHQPATDLGFLLHKNPENMHAVELAFGKAVMVYPEASDEKCTFAMTIDVDPIALVRGKHRGQGLLDQYVNDRPYAAASFYSVALARALNTAFAGRSNNRQELAARTSRLIRCSSFARSSNVARATYLIGNRPECSKRDLSVSHFWSLLIARLHPWPIRAAPAG